MPRRAPETLADYLVVAISPALIMVLIGSLVFFLIEVSYAGEFRLRLMWVMAMFIMGVVCISRIAMEDGAEYATLFALPLGGVMILAIIQFVPGGLAIGLPLMGLVWWLAYKLTWDCTLIDDTQDASGQGLLQQMGFEEGDPNASAANAGVTTSGAAEATSTADDRAWWQRWFAPDRRPHAPGVWLIYFSLVALPMFGLGGWFVPSGDGELRWRVFRLLAIYVAAALSLLVATSFLGLRRYLRQRRLQMPLDMAATWVVLGAVIIVVTLLAALVLPRPRSDQSLASVPSRVSSAVRSASRFAVGPEGTQDAAKDRQVATTEAQKGQEAQRTGESRQEKGQEGSQSGQGQDQDSSGQGKSDGKGGKGDGKSQGKSEGGKSDAGKQGGSEGKGKADERGDAGTSDEQDGSRGDKSAKSDPSQDRPADRSDQQQGEGQQQPSSSEQRTSSSEQRRPQPDGDQQRASTGAQPSPQSSPAQAISNLVNSLGQSLGSLLKWIFYAALAIAGLVLAWKYREQLAAAWRKLLEELRQLWAGLFGGQERTEDAAATETAAPPRPFSAFSDPFLTGAAARMAWPDLVRYTFQAVEAWAREHGTPRHPDQTPHEFAHALAAEHPEIDRHVRTLAAWYSQLAYAPAGPGSGVFGGDRPTTRENRSPPKSPDPVVPAAPDGSVEPLRELWHQLASRRPVAMPVGQ